MPLATFTAMADQAGALILAITRRFERGLSSANSRLPV
jgi:hypothetical protein